MFNYATGKQAKQIHTQTLDAEENGYYPHVDKKYHYGIYREGNKYICFDNSGHECWSEEYNTFNEAYTWLTKYDRPHTGEDVLGVRINYKGSLKIALFIDHWQENNPYEEMKTSEHNIKFTMEFNSFLEQEIKDKELIRLFKI